VDRPALQQVLVNLVTNAAEAVAGRGGTVTLSARRMARGPAGDPDGAGGVWGCVEIADDGPGMDPHILERAFDPFFSTRTSAAGCLPVARGLVHAHGGRLELSSLAGHRVGSGCPRARRPSWRRYDHADPPPVGAGPRFGRVLVGRRPAVLRATQRLPPRAGHEVLTATSGAAVALFTAAVETIGSDGADPHARRRRREVLAAIRRLRPETWVVVASGYDVTGCRASAAVQPTSGCRSC
jgi:hypothetical protein